MNAEEALKITNKSLRKSSRRSDKWEKKILRKIKKEARLGRTYTNVFFDPIYESEAFILKMRFLDLGYDVGLLGDSGHTQMLSITWLTDETKNIE